jgi:hypothetical protein
MIHEMTFQLRVADFAKGLAWYQTLLQREPDFVPHEGFVEWEVLPGCWLQLAEGTPVEGSGPIRLAVIDLEAERERMIRELKVEPFEIFQREEVPVKWGTFADPWGNGLGFFEYLDEAEKAEKLKRFA